MLICADIRGSDSNNAGLFIELDAILAVVIGGGSLAGGRIYLGLTIVGVLIIQGLTTSILVSGLPAQFNMIVKGVVVLLVLLLQSRRLRQAIVGLFTRRTS
jgi:simple sugar transport system permease protein